MGKLCSIYVILPLVTFFSEYHCRISRGVSVPAMSLWKVSVVNPGSAICVCVCRRWGKVYSFQNKHMVADIS
jgi:hypothetical protein